MEEVVLAEDKVFVAVPVESRAGHSTLSWVLDHIYGRASTTIIFIHVHILPQIMPIMGMKRRRHSG